MYIYIYTCILTHTTYTYTNILVHTYKCEHTYAPCQQWPQSQSQTYLCTHINAYIHTHHAGNVCVCVLESCEHTYIHKYIHGYIHTYIRTMPATRVCVLTCSHANTHTYINTYIHTYIRTLPATATILSTSFGAGNRRSIRRRTAPVMVSATDMYVCMYVCMWLGR